MAPISRGRPLSLDASRDRLRANLSGAYIDNADLTGAHLEHANLTGANLEAADLTGAHFEHADLTNASLMSAALTGAHLEAADLIAAHLEAADLTGASLTKAEITGVHLDGADLTCAHLENADFPHQSKLELTCASLERADLTDSELNKADLVGASLYGADLTGSLLYGADLTRAFAGETDLIGAHLVGANLTGASLYLADLTGVDLSGADLTGSHLYGADLSHSALGRTDLSDADLTLAKLWYADFEPKVLSPLNTVARTEGLQTLRWSESFDEIRYRHQLEEAEKPNSQVKPPPSPSSLPDRWLLWLSRYREILMGQTKGWRDDLGFLWNDAFYGLQPHQSKQGLQKKTDSETKLRTNPLATKPLNEGPVRHTAEEQNGYPLIDMRNALNRAGYSQAELQVNLAYQRHTQSALGMILYDWTCEYGAAPFRPLMIAWHLRFLRCPSTGLPSAKLGSGANSFLWKSEVTKRSKPF